MSNLENVVVRSTHLRSSHPPSLQCIVASSSLVETVRCSTHGRAQGQSAHCTDLQLGELISF
jgi:hypothetical protein